MEKGNVLVIGNSGVGKSTLINAVLGIDRAETGYGTEGTTKELKIYESDSDDIKFRLIDTVGFEPSFFKEQLAIGAVKKWSKDSAKEGKVDTQINLIWFCIDGTSRKLFDKTIKNLSRATGIWPSVPIIVVITKSYSIPERDENIDMVNNAFAKQKRYSKNLKKVIPVVASTYVLRDDVYAAPEGITELIGLTNDLLPEGLKAAAVDIARFKLCRKRVFAQGVVSVATTGAVIVGAAPVPFSDALILSPTELVEIREIARIYDINKDENLKRFINSIIEAGTVGVAAKAIINVLKTIPGVGIGASVINAVIAGCVVALLGEISIYVFEQIYLGNKSVQDIDWVTKIIESRFSNGFVEKVNDAINGVKDSSDAQSIVQTILNLFSSSKDRNITV